MDENFSWKIILIATIFSLFVLGVAYYFIAPSQSPFFSEERTEKIAEFSNTHISGRKDGKKIWKFFVKEGWTGKNHNINYLKDIKNGNIYSNGKLVLKDLTAPAAKAFRHTEIIEAFGPLTAYLDFGRISNPDNQDEWTKMTADHLKYYPNADRSEIDGNIRLTSKDNSIFAQKIAVDHEYRIAKISGDIKFKRQDGTLSANHLAYFSEGGKLEANENVILNIVDGKTKTKLSASQAIFFRNIDKAMTLKGSVEAIQGKKVAISEKGIYSQKKKELNLAGGVKAVFEKAQVMLKDKTAQNLKNPGAKKILAEKTVLTSNNLTFSTKSGDARAQGAVKVIQKGKEAKADKALYNDEAETLTLTGNVYMKKENEWVKAKKVVVSVKDETFEAIGA
ncbi:MAG: LPS export ABC transporter periplasmic protein LptC, partial [Candidatus Saganbacteria bacterium]|nr:LPS export ABC transporter periplasmic protein LptC [Candidatus Saganbacteria bacterium]